MFFSSLLLFFSFFFKLGALNADDDTDFESESHLEIENEIDANGK